MSDPYRHDDDLRQDGERLAEIAERILAGEPIESFDLGEWEIFVVSGYVERATFGPIA